MKPPVEDKALGPGASADDAIPGDRGRSPITDSLRTPWVKRAVPLLGLSLGAVIFLALTWQTPRKAKTEPLKPAEQVVTFDADKVRPGATRRPTLSDPGPNPPSLGSEDFAVPALDPGPTPRPAGPEAGAQAPSPDPLAAPSVLVFSRKADRPDRAPIAAPFIAAASSSAQPVATELEALRKGSTLAVLRAERLPDRNFLIVAGALLPCVLTTAIDSNTPGHVACLLARDVYSDNGAVVLLEKGSRILGEYRGGLRRGQRRIFVVWTRAVTPGGVAVPLGSPATDALGRAGFDGQIDTRFWARFGGALMLSLVDDGAYAAWGGGDEGRTRLPSDAAAAALEGSADIVPSLRKAQGAEVMIFVAHDLDFSAVYGLEATP